MSTVAVVAAGTAVAGWVLLDAWTGAGRMAPPLPWTVVGGTAVLAVAVVAAGLPVRRWVNGDHDRPLDPLFAARVVVLAKAAAYGGAVLTGWYAAQALDVLPGVVGVRRTRLVVAVAAAVAAVAVTVAGFVVQRWCRVPPREDDDSDSEEDPAA